MYVHDRQIMWCCMHHNAVCFMKFSLLNWNVRWSELEIIQLHAVIFANRCLQQALIELEVDEHVQFKDAISARICRWKLFSKYRPLPCCAFAAPRGVQHQEFQSFCIVSKVENVQRICSPSSTDSSFTRQRVFQSVVYLQRMSRVLQQKMFFFKVLYFAVHIVKPRVRTYRELWRVIG